MMVLVREIQLKRIISIIKLFIRTLTDDFHKKIFLKSIVDEDLLKIFYQNIFSTLKLLMHKRHFLICILDIKVIHFISCRWYKVTESLRVC